MYSCASYGPVEKFNYSYNVTWVKTLGIVFTTIAFKGGHDKAASMTSTLAPAFLVLVGDIAHCQEPGPNTLSSCVIRSL